MPVHFIVSGQRTFVERLAEGEKINRLAPKLYSLEFSSSDGYYLLHIADKHILPEKIYGNFKEAAKRVIKTHFSRQGNTGILLTGLKGSGKTLFVKIICNEMIERGFPVIQINKAYPGAEISNFIENLGDCTLVFDEFGKNYSAVSSSNGNTQLNLLNLLDGLGVSKRLHLFTENNIDLISSYLLNRPSRIYYHFKYMRLSENIITEYCKDMGVPESITQEILNISSRIKSLNFDALSCLVNEWKIHGGNIADYLEILNIDIFKSPNNNKVKLISFTKADGTSLDPKDAIVRTTYDERIYIDFLPKSEIESSYMVGPVGLSNILSVKGDIYTFQADNGDKFSLKLNLDNYF